MLVPWARGPRVDPRRPAVARACRRRSVRSWGSGGGRWLQGVSRLSLAAATAVGTTTFAPMTATSVTAGSGAGPGGGGRGASFASVLGHALSQVNGLQVGADQAAQALAAGGGNDLATAVIAAEKANLSLQLAVTVRNQAIGAYQQLMQMQV